MDASQPRDPERSSAARTDEAFRLLADETRLELLQALWETHDPLDGSPVGFAALRDRVTADDPGRIHYHLTKLTTHFVRRTDDGYELREAGYRIVRILRSGIAIDDPELDPVPVDVSCWYCGGQPTLRYHDGWRYLECTSCEARCVDTFPPGVISKNEFPPSGIRDRTPNEINDADRIWGTHRRATVMDGVCPECAGNMPIRSIDVCPDHHPDWDAYQFCDDCGSIFWMLVTHICEGCKYRWRLPTLFYPTREPAVISFFHDHGVELDLATHEQRTHLLDFEEELLSRNPLRFRITIPLDDEQLRLTYDYRMDVTASSRGPRTTADH